jgi:hypothetical protein
MNRKHDGLREKFNITILYGISKYNKYGLRNYKEVEPEVLA